MTYMVCRRTRRTTTVPAATMPKMISAHVAGSGTTVMSSPQFTSVLWSPVAKSAKNNVHVPPLFRLLNVLANVAALSGV